MKTLLILLFLLSSIVSVDVIAAQKSIKGVKIKRISINSSSRDLLIQTYPRHEIKGLNCKDNSWLKLPKNVPSYDEIFTLLIAAQQGRNTVNVFVTDTGGTKNNPLKFCRLSRIVIKDTQ